MYMTIETLTPELAETYLAKSKGNRAIRKNKIWLYSRSLESGEWKLTHQGIAFNTAGDFIDGHHRCHTVIATGRPMQTAVFRDVPIESSTSLDLGLPRTMRDVLLMACMGNYSNDLLAVMRNMLYPMSCSGSVGHRYTPDDMVLLLETFGDAGEFACTMLKPHSTGISRSARTLLARAFYNHNRERVESFASAIISGIIENNETDTAAITYRNFLLATSKSAGSQLEVERYKKGQTALTAYLKFTNAGKCYGTDKDLFPIPSELQSRVAHLLCE